MKIVTVVGARPQFVKAAVVSRAIAGQPGMQEVIVHTGQHYDENMSAIFFGEMGIPAPHYHLNVHSLNHGEMTGRMLGRIEKVLLEEKPDCVMVYGDTNTTLAGALAAKKLHHKVVHVEAGLRSYNMRMPEEVNRVLTDRISDLLCCPTDRAVGNLRAEGFDNFPCRMVKTGDVMQDAARYYRGIASSKPSVLRKMGLEGKRYALCTVHRSENTDDASRLSSILAALNEISREGEVVLPLHPRTAKRIRSHGIRLAFRPIDPVGYFDMLQLLQDAEVVLTDSGGLQKEAFFFGKPCVTLREETEWVELVEGGFNRLGGVESRGIVAAYEGMRVARLDFDVDLYGNGNASQKVVEAVRLLPAP